MEGARKTNGNNNNNKIVIVMITEQFFSEIGTQNSSGLEELDF